MPNNISESSLHRTREMLNAQLDLCSDYIGNLQQLMLRLFNIAINPIAFRNHAFLHLIEQPWAQQNRFLLRRTFMHVDSASDDIAEMVLTINDFKATIADVNTDVASLRSDQSLFDQPLKDKFSAVVSALTLTMIYVEAMILTNARLSLQTRQINTHCLHLFRANCAGRIMENEVPIFKPRMGF